MNLKRDKNGYMGGEERKRNDVYFILISTIKEKMLMPNLRKFYNPPPRMSWVLNWSHLKNTWTPLNFRIEVLILFQCKIESEVTFLGFLPVFESLLLWFAGMHCAFGCLSVSTSCCPYGLDRVKAKQEARCLSEQEGCTWPSPWKAEVAQQPETVSPVPHTSWGTGPPNLARDKDHVPTAGSCTVPQCWSTQLSNRNHTVHCGCGKEL